MKAKNSNKFKVKIKGMVYRLTYAIRCLFSFCFIMPINMIVETIKASAAYNAEIEKLSKISHNKDMKTREGVALPAAINWLYVDEAIEVLARTVDGKALLSTRAFINTHMAGRKNWATYSIAELMKEIKESLETSKTSADMKGIGEMAFCVSRFMEILEKK